jgi:hypothetical protein
MVSWTKIIGDGLLGVTGIRVRELVVGIVVCHGDGYVRTSQDKGAVILLIGCVQFRGHRALNEP